MGHLGSAADAIAGASDAASSYIYGDAYEGSGDSTNPLYYGPLAPIVGGFTSGTAASTRQGPNPRTSRPGRNPQQALRRGDGSSFPPPNGIPLNVPPAPVGDLDQFRYDQNGQVFKVTQPSSQDAKGAEALRPKSGGVGAGDDGSTPESNAARSKAQYDRNKGKPVPKGGKPDRSTFTPTPSKIDYSSDESVGPIGESNLHAASSTPATTGRPSPNAPTSPDPLKQLNMAYKVAQDPLMSWEARSAAHRVITEHFESQAALARAARHQADFDAAMQIRATETARKAKVQGDWDQASSNARKAAASAPQGPPDYEAQDARSRALLDPANIANARSQTDWNALQGVDQSRVQSFQHEQDMSRQMRGMGLDPSGDEAARLRFLAGDRMPDSVFSAHPRAFGPSGPQNPQQYHNTFNLREGRPMELDPSFLAQQEAQNFAWQARGAQIEDKANQASQDSYFLRQKRDQAGSQLNPWTAMSGGFSY